MAADSPKVRKFVVQVKQDEDGWLVATVDGLRGVHTQAKTLATLEKRILDAIMLYHEMEEHEQRPGKRLDSKGLHGASRPKVEGTFRIEVPA